MTAPTSSTRQAPMAANLAIGAGANFFDTLGIGSFATTTAVLRLFHLAEDDDIPGTLNVGHAIPTMLEAILFVITMNALIDNVTIVSMVLAGGIGAWFGTGIVVRWPKQQIQRAMAIALLATAGFIAMRLLLTLTHEDGGVTAFRGMPLVIAIVASVVIGSLTSLGIGNYAPTMAVTYMLGLNARAVWPIMACSASLILPAAAIRFYRSGRFNKNVALGLTLGGIPGVLVATYLIKSLPLTVVKWMVVAVLLYTSVTLWISSQKSTSTAP